MAIEPIEPVGTAQCGDLIGGKSSERGLLEQLIDGLREGDIVALLLPGLIERAQLGEREFSIAALACASYQPNAKCNSAENDQRGEQATSRARAATSQSARGR